MRTKLFHPKLFGAHMAERYSVYWTSEAQLQVNRILQYILDNWTERECQDFLDILFHFERTIAAFPKLFKESHKLKGVRLGFVHKHITAVYKLSKNQITVLTVIDNRMDLER